MKLFIIPLAILSMSAFATAPDCKGLGSIISNLETDLQRSRLSDCQKVFLKDQLKADEKLDPEIEEHYNGARCEPLGKLELDIQKIEGQLATLRALQEFSKDLSKKHQVLKKVPTTKELNKKVALQAQNLNSGLKTAFTLESLLSIKDSSFIEELKERTSTGPLTQRDFDEVYKAKCASKAVGCTTMQELAPYLSDPNVLNEIGIVLKSSSLDKNGIEALKSSLKISTADGKEMSYSDINAKLKGHAINLSQISAETKIETDVISVLKEIPDFAPQGNLSFIEKMNEAKNAVETKAIIDSFKYTSEEIALRNRMTQKSKMGAIINSINRGKTIPEDVKTACGSLLKPEVAPNTCLEKLENFVGTLDQAYESDKIALSSIRSLQDSNEQIEKFQSMCLNEQQLINNAQTTTEGTVLRDCNQSFISEEAILAKKLNALNLVRSKLLSENKPIQDYRNFAIAKLDSNTCSKDSTMVSIIGNCSTTVSAGLTPVMEILTADVLNVAVMYRGRIDDSVDISEYCENENLKKTNDQLKLCEYLTAEDKLPNNPGSSNDSVSAPTDVDSRAGHDAKMNALQGAISNIAGALGQQNRTYYNPYNYNNMYRSNYNPMTISDSLTYGSVMYGGYGGYYPMANNSPFMYNSQLFGYMGATAGTGSLYSYSTSGTSSSSYGISSFLPTFSF